MSGVTPTDGGGYNYYHKQIGELEDELKAEAKRGRERQESALTRAEESHKSDLRKKEKDLESTVKEIRENTSEAIAREREASKSDLDKMKAQTYDKWGRYGGNESDVARSQLQDVSHALEEEQARGRQRLGDMEEAYSLKMEDSNLDHAAEISRAVENERKSSRETYTEQAESEKNQYQQLKEDETKKYQELNRQVMDERNFQRRQMQKVVSDTKRDAENRYEKLKSTNETRFENQQKVYDAMSDERAYSGAKSHGKETAALRDQLKDLTQAQSDYVSSKGSAQAEAVKEFEDEWRMRQKLVEDGYEDQIRKLKRQLGETEEYMGALNNRNLREKDLHYTKIIKANNQENHKMHKDLADSRIRDREQMDLRMKLDQQHAAESSGRQLYEANVAKDEALRKQALAYQESMGSQKNQDNTKIESLQRQLQESRTSDDTSLISPAAEAAVRKAVVSEYEKILAEEHGRNRRSEESIQTDYSHRLNDTIFDKDDQSAKTASLTQQDRHNERMLLMEGIKDAEFMKETTLRNQDLSHTRELERMNKAYARMLEGQRRQYEEILSTQKNDATVKLQGTRQELEFESKMASRAFSEKQNELIRTYEKKLVDQKSEYEDVIREVKADTDKKVREADRIRRQALEEQGRAYDQKIAQLEVQQKERERYMTQNFQDELEKVKRSNAELVKKKS